MLPPARRPVVFFGLLPERLRCLLLCIQFCVLSGASFRILLFRPTRALPARRFGRLARMRTLRQFTKPP